MNATEKAMVAVRTLWFIAGCLQLLKGAGHA
jgi:hypothetical protein